MIEAIDSRKSTIEDTELVLKCLRELREVTEQDFVQYYFSPPRIHFFAQSKSYWEDTAENMVAVRRHLDTLVEQGKAHKIFAHFAFDQNVVYRSI